MDWGARVRRQTDQLIPPPNRNRFHRRELLADQNTVRAVAAHLCQQRDGDAASRPAANPGMISYTTLLSAAVLPQIPTTTAPTIMPAIAPLPVSLGQYRDNTMTGPKAAPKTGPGEADEVEDGAAGADREQSGHKGAEHAHPAKYHVRARSLFFAEDLEMSSTSADEQTMSCEEMVDITAASTAASTNPATSGWNTI